MTFRISRSPAAALGVAAVVLLAASACSTGEGDLANEEPSAPQAEVTITPEDGASEIRPDTPIVVSATDGTITDVQVEQSVAEGQGDSGMTGTLNKDKTEWVSDWTLKPGSEVTVTAVAENEAGEETEVISDFTTKPAVEGQRLEVVSVTPAADEEVGVGMPIIVDFDLPVENKAQVEAAMEVTSEKPAQGAWNWVSDQQAVFRPEKYWEPDQRIDVNLHLAGVAASEGVYGVENREFSFRVGREQITTIDEDEHHMVVERDGEVVKEFPVSLGMATTEKYTTTSGTHITMEFQTNYRMSNDTLGVSPDSPEYYEEFVAYAVRISNSGEFLHTADWNYQLGEANTSHGCVNMSTADSQWYYENSLLGDPVDITGTTRELEWNNGWGFWQRSWDDWVANSATGEADDTAEPGTPGSPHFEE
ncbi:Ig-like domain-containing protein [Streptomonospora sp. S1-112]|uniref:Ig-like domain-containing protein n=1 Tax=Streptomonospora mangrovi TaxID=2883123 RepID=A0A9X3NQS6_9ACTN|nr:Ig-like domain-containing protein [Streptomonospora mangrovi]MDA0566551.1 Ig-like domain-containing protein [Streptomonospora mangrovi]